uniref:Uncharacterized protein n=2 Tax=Bursaphelenchus xylophilus TaxID=6326 RepID=A0A1I7SHB2_BURXY
MVSLSDSEWLTVFFSVVALLLFCVLVCLMVHTMLCAIGEESESNLDVKPVRSVKSNLVLSADRRLVRA